MRMKHSIFKGLDFSTPALILKCVEDSHIGLGAVRSLGRLGAPVYGIGGSQRIPSTHSRYFRDWFFHEIDANTPDEEVVDFVLGVARKIGRSVPLITVDVFACLVAKNYEAFREFFILPEMDPALVRNS